MIAVHFGEKEMKLFSATSPRQQSFELEAKVKWEKTGRRKTDGWARKVLRIPLCQQANRPTRKPGRKKVETAMAAPTAISGL